MLDLLSGARVRPYHIESAKLVWSLEPGPNEANAGEKVAKEKSDLTKRIPGGAMWRTPMRSGSGTRTS